MKNQSPYFIPLIIATLFLSLFFIFLQNSLFKNSKLKTRLPTGTVKNYPPTPTPSLFCGGIAGRLCPAGFTCRLDGDYPDASGTCISQSSVDCVVSGCNHEVCSPASSPQVSTCIYKPEFACFSSAICELQPSGECGWTYTPAYHACLQELL